MNLRKFAPAIIFTFALFTLWGVGHRLYDTLVPDFAKAFNLDSGQLLLTQSVYNLVYVLLAIPAAIYSRALGSKATMVFGLGAWAVGAFLFYPAALQHEFLFFLFAAGVMSCGYIFLEIAANPLIAQLGTPETATRRLNFAHALYPVGLFIAIYVGRWLILSNNSLPVEKLANAVVRPYMVLGGLLLVLAFIVDQLAFPPAGTARSTHRAVMNEFRMVARKPLFLAAIAAQFCNVAAQAGSWSLCTSYVETVIPGASASFAADIMLTALILFGIGRFAGALLMFRFDSDRLLAVFSGAAALAALIAACAGGTVGMYALIAFCFAASILFASILGAAIRDLGPAIKAGAALMFMGGAAGAAAGTAAMKLIASAFSVQAAMLVPVIGCIAVTAFAVSLCRHKARAPELAVTA